MAPIKLPFVVQAGSSCRKEWSLGSAGHNYAKLFDELVSTGVVVIYEGRGRFTANYAFKSPSAAAAVVNGRPANGTTEWKIVGIGKTYKEWEEEKLVAVDSTNPALSNFEYASASNSLQDTSR